MYVVLVVGTLLCAVLAIRAARLLTATLWLAGVSVLTAIIFYLVGAKEIAVIELSVGAGLVTVLFVFAISIAGEDAMQARPLVPRPLAWGLVGLAVVLLLYLIWPLREGSAAASGVSFNQVFWTDRALDVIAQIAMIFSGVLGVLGLLAEPQLYQTAHLVESSEAETVPPEAELAAQSVPEKEAV